ncbi:hypothetical protein ACFLUZ_04500 [Chloroflexota bacterium]
MCAWNRLFGIKSRAIFVSIALIVIMGILISSSFMEVPSEKDLRGDWEGEYNEMELVFMFNSDGTCLLSFKDSASGETNEMSGNFEVDFTKEPIPLSIRNIPQLNYALHTIIKFTNDGSLMIADFAPRRRVRPIAFHYDTSMNLRPAD